jgi:hypothetical protein
MRDILSLEERSMANRKRGSFVFWRWSKTKVIAKLTLATAMLGRQVCWATSDCPNLLLKLAMIRSGAVAYLIGNRKHLDVSVKTDIKTSQSGTANSTNLPEITERTRQNVCTLLDQAMINEIGHCENQISDEQKQAIIAHLTHQVPPDPQRFRWLLEKACGGEIKPLTWAWLKKTPYSWSN